MADPITIMMFSAAMSGVTAIASGNAAAAQAESQANAANYNAIMAEQNASTARQAANVNEEAMRRKTAHQMGQLRAGLAENGVGLNSGTAGDLTAESAMNAELDALNIRYSGATQARDYQAQAALGLQQAEQARNNAATARTSGYLTAGASALQGYGKYVGYEAQRKNPLAPNPFR